MCHITSSIEPEVTNEIEKPVFFFTKFDISRLSTNDFFFAKHSVTITLCFKSLFCGTEEFLYNIILFTVEFVSLTSCLRFPRSKDSRSIFFTTKAKSSIKFVPRILTVKNLIGTLKHFHGNHYFPIFTSENHRENFFGLVDSESLWPYIIYIPGVVLVFLTFDATKTFRRNFLYIFEGKVLDVILKTCGVV